jgi:hypothetical protein
VTDEAAEKQVSGKYLAKLHSLLSTQLNKGELLLLCYKLDVDYHTLSGGRRPGPGLGG